MSNRYVGTKTEMWYHTVYDLVSHRYIRHYIVVETSLWSTKGWRRTNKKKFSKAIARHDLFPKNGYKLKWSK